MRPRIALVLLLGVGVTVTAIIVAQTKSSRVATQNRVQGVVETAGDKSRRPTVRTRAQQAEAKGRTEIDLPRSSGDYLTVNSVEQAAKSHTAVIAEPVQVESRLEDDGETINSWYKFRIVETLSEPTPYPYSFGSPPGELLPLNQNEFAAYLPGGSLMVGGVKVISRPPESPALPLFKKHLLFIDLDATNRVARIEYGPDSIFSVKEDGSVEAYNGRVTPLQLNAEARYGNSLDRIKSGLKNKPLPR
ncbi:MAG TPA: hypothetical protein VJ866_11690 [Pyrinomonadaceae bacterium]|nr:hypothetical protein [Pyrinomonadaceae bacterium]